MVCGCGTLLVPVVVSTTMIIVGLVLILDPYKSEILNNSNWETFGSIHPPFKWSWSWQSPKSPSCVDCALIMVAIGSWEALTRAPFDGIRLCFGQLVYYRRKHPTKKTLEPNMAPGLFWGWRVDSGLRYRCVVTKKQLKPYSCKMWIKWTTSSQTIPNQCWI